MTKKIKIRSIKVKLMIPVCLLLLLLVTTFLIKSYQNESAAFLKGKQSRFKAEYHQFLGLIHDTAVTSYSMAEIVAGMPDVQKSLAEKNRPRLLELTLPLYRSGLEKLNIKQFQFHLPPATSFLRLHKVDKYGDDLSGFRFTVLEANQEKRPKYGIEKGRFGLGFRGVAPVAYQGKHVGTVEFGSKLNDKFLDQQKKENNIDIAVLIPDGESFKFQAQTREMTISPKIYSSLRKVMETDQTAIKIDNKENRRFMTFLGPLKDFSGKNVGVILIPSEITSHVNQMKKTIFIYLGIGILLTLLVLTVVYFIVEYLINRPIKEMIQVFNKAGEGDLTDRVKVKKDDEMAELGKGFNDFLGKIQQMLKNIAKNSKMLASSSNELFSISQQMSAGSEQTSGKSNTVAAAAEEMNSNMTSVAAATEQASTNVSMVATATEEMTSTISEIAQNS
nr:methyl-accepting chemotaxis protein [Desulfobacterales bacterium]